MRWDGATWGVWPVPTTVAAVEVELLDVDACDADTAWAVGCFGTPPLSRGCVLAWNGTDWVEEVVPAPAQSSLYSVAAVSANEAWAVGWRITKGGLVPWLLEWNGSTWSTVEGQLPVEVSSVMGIDLDVNGTLWACGYAKGKPCVIKGV